AFVRKHDELRRHLLHLKRSEKLQALLDRYAKILLAVEDERGGFEILDEPTWRPLLIHVRAIGWHAAELPEREPKLLGRPRFARKIENTVVRHERLEPGRMAQEPIDHITPIRRASRHHAVRIDVGQRGDRIGYRHDVVVSFAAPIPIDLIDEFL